MKREYIENASRDYSGGWAITPIHVNDIYRRDDFEAGFMTGSEWRIDSVWHDAKETPNERKFCLYILKDGSYGCGYYHKRDNTILYEQFENVNKWAYFDDLIPFLED